MSRIFEFSARKGNPGQASNLLLLVFSAKGQFHIFQGDQLSVEGFNLIPVNHDGTMYPQKVYRQPFLQAADFFPDPGTD